MEVDIGVAMTGNGKNGNYTAQQFIDAIPGTGGIVTEIAKRVGCAWNTAKKYIEEYATINIAWQNERNRINDLAKSNIIKAMEGDEDNPPDIQTSKWWLGVMDKEFMPKSKVELESESIKVSVYMPDNARE